LFPEEELSLSGGNFHALYGARVSDTLAASLTILSTISERRIAQLMSTSATGLPAFLVNEGGLNSGLMMAHVTAAALVGENKSLCMPASVDSIPTSDDREDHVSMGPGAGYKALQICENLSNVLAIEIFSAFQALTLLLPLKSYPKLETVMKKLLASKLKPLTADRVLAGDIKIIKNLISNEGIISL
jgi:histidine ammonia-lyase